MPICHQAVRKENLRKCEIKIRNLILDKKLGVERLYNRLIRKILIVYFFKLIALISKSFIVLAFIFRSRIHFKLIFICGVRLGSRFKYFAIQICMLP